MEVTHINVELGDGHAVEDNHKVSKKLSEGWKIVEVRPNGSSGAGQSYSSKASYLVVMEKSGGAA